MKTHYQYYKRKPKLFAEFGVSICGRGFEEDNVRFLTLDRSKVKCKLCRRTGYFKANQGKSLTHKGRK